MAIVALFLLAPSTAAAAAELTTLKGKKVSGDLVSADEKTVVIKTADGNVSTPVPEILAVELNQKPEVKFPEKYVDVELTDGTLFHCKQFALRGKNIELTVLPEFKLTLPTRNVVYILNDAQDPKLQKEWQNILAERGRTDRFAMRRDDRLDGLEGTFGDADEKGEYIPFVTTSGAKRNIPIAQLTAMLFNNRLEGNIPKTVCRVVDAHRNNVVAQKVSYSSGKLNVTTVGGVTVEYPTLDPLVRLDYSKDKIVYLSDLRPTREERSSDELNAVVARDISLDNVPIQLEGVVYPKGLVLHSGVDLTFDIGGDYKEFQTVIGVDPTLQTASRVKLVIQGDGRELFSTEVKHKDKPKPLNLDVKKVRQLRIIVTADFLFGNQVTLADAKVTK